MNPDVLSEIRHDVKILLIQGAANTATLQEHMKRTQLSESRIEKLEYWLLGLIGTGLTGVLIALTKAI